MAQPDPIAALRVFLLAEVEAPVDAGELQDVEQMPQQVVLIMPAGGDSLGRGKTYGDKRVDVDCYGATPKDAWDLYLTVAPALEGLRREVHSGVLLHWALPSAGGSSGRDPKSDWPVTLSSWQVLTSKVAAS